MSGKQDGKPQTAGMLQQVAVMSEQLQAMGKMVTVVMGVGNILRRNGVPEAQIEGATKEIWELWSATFCDQAGVTQ